jgi:hypothetical protein
MKRTAAILVFGLLACSPAFAFRCGNKLVSEGDTREQVVSKCGEPADIINMASVFRRPIVYGYRGRPYYVGENYVEVPVESWIYNLGPNKLMRRLRFEGGLVTDIETLGYGYN